MFSEKYIKTKCLYTYFYKYSVYIYCTCTILISFLQAVVSLATSVLNFDLIVFTWVLKGSDAYLVYTFIVT